MKTGNTPRLHVYQAINQIVRAFAKSGIAKRHINAADQYQYRSIDDVMDRLGPLLARCGLCVLPRALSRESEDRTAEGGTLLVSVRLLVAFDLVSVRDGSLHVIRAWGEALDQGDKGTAKAMSAAFKGAMLQLFCIPTGAADADSSSLRLSTHQTPEPVEGWACWTDGIVSMIGVCESGEGLDRIRSRQAKLLGALSREKPDLYKMIGERFIDQRRILTDGPQVPAPLGGRVTATAKAVPSSSPDKPIAALPKAEAANA